MRDDAEPETTDSGYNRLWLTEDRREISIAHGIT